MTNNRKVYTKIMQKLKKMMPQTPQNQVVTTAIMVTGIVLDRKAQLAAINLEVPHPAKRQTIIAAYARQKTRILYFHPYCPSPEHYVKRFPETQLAKIVVHKNRSAP